MKRTLTDAYRGFSIGEHTPGELQCVALLDAEGECVHMIFNPWRPTWRKKAIPVTVVRNHTIDVEASRIATEAEQARLDAWLAGPEPAQIEAALARMAARAGKPLAKQEAA